MTGQKWGIKIRFDDEDLCCWCWAMDPTEAVDLRIRAYPSYVDALCAASTTWEKAYVNGRVRIEPIPA